MPTPGLDTDRSIEASPCTTACTEGWAVCTNPRVQSHRSHSCFSCSSSQPGGGVFHFQTASLLSSLCSHLQRENTDRYAACWFTSDAGFTGWGYCSGHLSALVATRTAIACWLCCGCAGAWCGSTSRGEVTSLSAVPPTKVGCGCLRVCCRTLEQACHS